MTNQMLSPVECIATKIACLLVQSTLQCSIASLSVVLKHCLFVYGSMEVGGEEKEPRCPAISSHVSTSAI